MHTAGTSSQLPAVKHIPLISLLFSQNRRENIRSCFAFVVIVLPKFLLINTCSLLNSVFFSFLLLIWRKKKLQPQNSRSMHSTLISSGPLEASIPQGIAFNGRTMETVQHTRCKSSFGWVLLYVHRNRKLIGDGSPGRPPRLSHRSWALESSRARSVAM